MIVSVVICSVNRPLVLHRTVDALLRQNRLPDCIVVSAGSASDVDEATHRLEGVQIVQSPKIGSSSQRNYALRFLPDDKDQVVVFLDDDVMLEAAYLSKVEDLFLGKPNLLGASATVLVNGGIDWEEGLQIIRDAEREASVPLEVRSSGKHWVAHGCNMVFRIGALEKEAFDEELPLYSFGEDYDISVRIARHGIVGKVDKGLAVVHLEHRHGRVRELRRGYSIVANNFHFLRKGVSHMPMKQAYARFWLVIVLKESVADLFNALGQFFRFKKGQMDHFGRLKGRVLASIDIVIGRSSPSRILELEGS